MKKGISHIDWAISMGIFLVYILSMFIFLRPSLTQPVLQEDLFPVLLEGLNKDIKYTIEKIPLYIDYTGDDKTIARITFTETNEFPFQGDDKDFALLDQNNNYLPFIANLNNQLGSIKFQYDYGLRNNRKYIFFLLYSSNLDYQSFIPTPEDENIPEEQIAKNDEDFTYKFGITESITGVSTDKLNELKNNYDYQALKQNWKFPNTQEFSLTIYDSSTFQYSQNDEILNFNKNATSQQANIYTKEFKDYILKPNIEFKPIIINFRFGELIIQ